MAQAHWKFSNGFCAADFAYTPKFFLISLTPLKQPKSHILYYYPQVMCHAGIQMERPTLKLSSVQFSMESPALKNKILLLQICNTSVPTFLSL